ncbi:MAG: threonine synthase [Anaerolineaceae bacterium]
MTYTGVLARFGSLLDIPSHAIPVTLLEGNTPLIPVPRLAEELGGGFNLSVKFEGVNPTGSFKDRGMTAAVSEALGRGAKAVICASTGNTAASAAAYAARAGMRAVVLIPQGKVATGKLAGAVAYGAEVIQIQGSFDDALDLVVKISERSPIALVNSLNPYRLEGQKTAAFEICEVMDGKAPDWLCLPVGNAGNITAYWMGFRQQNERTDSGLPAILGVQAEGSAPLVLGHPVNNPETVATAIRIGRPARGEQALLAAEESGGRIIAVSDDEILFMQRRLAASGVWVEPASAAGVAGLAHEIRAGRFDPKGKRIVAVCTGHGMKDPDIIAKSMPAPTLVPAELAALEDFIHRENKWNLKPVKVAVPATSANLGPGFDCLALALDLWNEAVFEPSSNGYSVKIEGEGKDELPGDEDNLIIQSASSVFKRVGATCPGLKVTCLNRIPLSSGLGSSAAATLMGLLGANEMLGKPLQGEDLLKMASDMEGHADNAAAALYGGLVTVLEVLDGLIWKKYPLPKLAAVLAVPKLDLPTHTARKALPAVVAFQDAVFNSSRTPLVVEALRTGDLTLLGQVIQDRLHQPYRLPLIPGANAAMAAALANGASAVALSGAGPSIIAFLEEGSVRKDAVQEAMVVAFMGAGLVARGYDLSVSNQGARIED